MKVKKKEKKRKGIIEKVIYAYLRVFPFPQLLSFLFFFLFLFLLFIIIHIIPPTPKKKTRARLKNNMEDQLNITILQEKRPVRKNLSIVFLHVYVFYNYYFWLTKYIIIIIIILFRSLLNRWHVNIIFTLIPPNSKCFYFNIDTIIYTRSIIV